MDDAQPGVGRPLRAPAGGVGAVTVGRQTREANSSPGDGFFFVFSCLGGDPDVRHEEDKPLDPRHSLPGPSRATHPIKPILIARESMVRLDIVTVPSLIALT